MRKAIKITLAVALVFIFFFGIYAINLKNSFDATINNDYSSITYNGVTYQKDNDFPIPDDVEKQEIKTFVKGKSLFAQKYLSPQVYTCSVGEKIYFELLSNRKNTESKMYFSNAKEINDSVKKLYMSFNSFTYEKSSYDKGVLKYEETHYDSSLNNTLKVCWNDNLKGVKVISAELVIAVGDKEIKKTPLKIETFDNDSKYTHRIIMPQSVSAKSDTNKNATCYVKLIASNSVEYHLMMTKVEKYNKENDNSAIYVIDNGKNKSLWLNDYYS